MIQDCWARSGEVNIHYLDRNVLNTGENMPVLYVPGALGFAEQFCGEMDVLSSRRCISISLRGRGKSDAPSIGYSFEHHVSDISAVVQKSRMNHFCMMAHSMSVPFALKYTIDNPDRVKGLILCDYPAQYPNLTERWVENVISKGLLRKEREYVATEIMKASYEVNLRERLRQVRCPVLVLRGGTNHAMLNGDEAQVYKDNLEDVQIVTFLASGHEFWVPDYPFFMEKVTGFLELLDQSNSSAI